MIVLSKTERQQKLVKLADIEGYESIEPMLEATITDSVCPAICVTPGCSYTEELEPDQDKGWCALCETNTMQSALILAGLI